MKNVKENGVFIPVTVVVCILATLGILLAFGNGRVAAHHKWAQEYVTQQEQALQEAVDAVEQCQQEFSIAELSVELKKQAYDAADNKVDEAEAALDKVCSRYYYNSYYCTSACRTLHGNVDTAQNTRSSRYDEWQDAKDEVATAENRLEQAQKEVPDLEEDVREARQRYEEVLPQYVFTLISAICFVVALGALAIWLFLREKKLLGKTAAGALALGAVILFFCNAATVVADVLLLGVAFILYRFAGDEEELNDRVWRNVAVVFSALTLFVAPMTGLVSVLLVAPLFAAALICALFVLVPLEFTKYIVIAKHLFLSVITFGIWTLVWIYHVTKNLNEVAGAETRKPAHELLLCMFLPLYYANWLYKTAEGVELYAAEQGKECKLESLALVFAFVNPLFATVLIQSKINWIAGRDSE